MNLEVLKVDVNSDSIDPSFKPVNDAELLGDLSKSLALFDDAEVEQTSRIKEVRADYASSSIGVSFDGTAYVKIIEFVPDVLHQSHRIESRHLRLYSSVDGAEYIAVPEEAYVYEKNEEGKITLTLNEILEAGIIKLHILFDDRDGELNAVDRAEFMAKLKNSLKIYQQSDSLKERYSYDKNGNRIRKTLEMRQLFITEPLYYKDSEWMLTDGFFAYTYDAAGNTTAKGNWLEIGGLAYSVESEEAATFLKDIAEDRTKEADLHFVESGESVELWQYEYDLLNRLVSLRKENNTVAGYGYDPDGLRTWKQVEGQRIHYLYHGNDVIFEKNISTGDVKSYVHAFGKHLARIDGVVGDENAEVYTYVTDHLGSVRAVTDEAGALLWEGEYSPFGELITEKVIDVDFYDSHRFTGKMWDAEIGLYYFNARYYNAKNGRFVTEDPVRDKNNWFVYVSNNPLNRIDPTGMVEFMDGNPGSEDEFVVIHDKNSETGVRILKGGRDFPTHFSRSVANTIMTKDFRWLDSATKHFEKNDPRLIGGIMNEVRAYYDKEYRFNLTAMSYMWLQMTMAVGQGAYNASKGFIDRNFSRINRFFKKAQNKFIPKSEKKIKGATGTHSGRPYDSEKSGGKIKNLKTKNVKITTKGIAVVEKHVKRFGDDKANKIMIQRLKDIASGKIKPTKQDLNFWFLSGIHG